MADWSDLGSLLLDSNARKNLKNKAKAVLQKLQSAIDTPEERQAIGQKVEAAFAAAERKGPAPGKIVDRVDTPEERRSVGKSMLAKMKGGIDILKNSLDGDETERYNEKVDRQVPKVEKNPITFIDREEDKVSGLRRAVEANLGKLEGAAAAPFAGALKLIDRLPLEGQQEALMTLQKKMRGEDGKIMKNVENAQSVVDQTLTSPKLKAKGVKPSYDPDGNPIVEETGEIDPQLLEYEGIANFILSLPKGKQKEAEAAFIELLRENGDYDDAAL